MKVCTYFVDSMIKMVLASDNTFHICMIHKSFNNILVFTGHANIVTWQQITEKLSQGLDPEREAKATLLKVYSNYATFSY